MNDRRTMHRYAPVRRRRLLAAVASLGLAAGLAACSSPSPATQPTTTAGTSASASAFPVTITSALGDAVIESKPERVATWGWSTQDAVLALGVVPVAMPAYPYGGVDGVLPWDAEAIKALGGQTPTLLKGGESGEVNVEEFVAARPDVILAPYSGLTQEEFDALSKVAPVVAYPDKPWATTWQDQATLVGKALGLADQAAQLVTDTQAKVAGLADKHPELKGKTFVYGAANEPEVLNIYRATDPRVQLLVELGMQVAPSVADLDPKPDEGTYFYGLSFEKLSKLDSDVLVAYFGSQKDADAFATDPLVAAMPQVKDGRFAPIVGESFVMASSAPTVLSIPWMLDQYVPQLAAAAAKSAG
jgi:iron complex transport system substrate-binding protein